MLSMQPQACKLHVDLVKLGRTSIKDMEMLHMAPAMTLAIGFSCHAASSQVSYLHLSEDSSHNLIATCCYAGSDSSLWWIPVI